MIRWSAEALAAETGVLYVVVPDEAAALREALDGLPVHWVVNSAARSGMATSIAAGIAALPATTDAVVIALADQPLVDSSVVALLATRWREGAAKAVAPEYDDGRGHPVLFDATLFAELGALEGDRGARQLLDTLGDRLATVCVAGPQPADVDTPAALLGVVAEQRVRGR